jgi:hypothetical protein
MMRQLLWEAFDMCRKAYGAITASANHLYTQTPSPTGGAAQSGTILPTPISFTPKVSGKVKVTFSFTGRSDAADREINLTPTVNGVGVPDYNISFAPGGNTLFDSNVGGSFTVSGLTLNTPSTFNFIWLSSAGTWRASPSLGGIVIEEYAG